MTGFDETVPPDDADPTRDAAATPAGHEPAGSNRESTPEHDDAVPALDDSPDPDEPGAA